MSREQTPIGTDTSNASMAHDTTTPSLTGTISSLFLRVLKTNPKNNRLNGGAVIAVLTTVEG